ncbi:MAG TPA: hypothetical protein VK666_07220 [Chryseolinea sp.]|nr:hypothetical protein [Chryseolinea sp.]
MKFSLHFRRPRIVITASTTMLAVAGLVCLSFTFKAVPGPIWNQLGISERTGTENIKKSFLEGYLYSYGASAAKKIAVGDRVGVANEVLSYCKQYVSSPAFKSEYDLAREEHKPVQPQNPKTRDAIKAEQIATLNKSIEEGEKSMKTLPADLIAPFQEVQQMLKDQIKEYEEPESVMLTMLVDGENFNYKNAMQQYENDLKAWEKNYPEDQMEMVKQRLNKFLTLTADVDYNAPLREEYRMKKFVNPAYEKKPAEWKMAYRSGKPVVETARTFAKEWLTELP